MEQMLFRVCMEDYKR
nr:unnamed protein product [Callosobruchus analis]